MSGLAEADICDPSQTEKSDNCTSGDPINDVCPEDDKCWSGTEDDDYCPPDYGLKAGDACPGGGSEFGFESSKNYHTHDCSVIKCGGVNLFDSFSKGK